MQRWLNYGREYSTVRNSRLSLRLRMLKSLTQGFWMSDKPLVQQALASELAEILLNVTSTKFALDFLQGFWEATVREWSGIDRLR